MSNEFKITNYSFVKEKTLISPENDLYKYQRINEVLNKYKPLKYAKVIINVVEIGKLRFLKNGTSFRDYIIINKVKSITMTLVEDDPIIDKKYSNYKS